MDRSPHKFDKTLRSRLPFVALIGATIILIAAIFYVVLKLSAVANTPTNTPEPTSNSSIPIPLRYGFDSGTMGWVPQTRMGDKAVIDIQPQIKFGESSLELQIELIGKDAEKSKGEAFVDLSSNPPLGVVAPLDLKGKPITISVYVPSVAIGNPDSPNGIQLFVTDYADRSQYGVWWNLTSDNTDRWTTITLRPSPKTSPTEEARGASTNVEFDPSKINIVGLKIGAGKAFEGVFRGSIWIDGVSWP